MSILTLEDTMMSMLTKMSKGNPGALAAIMDIIEKHDAIDPQAILGGTGTVLALDTLEIYGTDIYVLWSDKCGKDARKMLMLMRANQLGYLSGQRLREISHDQTRQINLTDDEFSELDSRVCERLEDFARPKTV